MPMPIRQSVRVGSYLMRQKLAGNRPSRTGAGRSGG